MRGFLKVLVVLTAVVLLPATVFAQGATIAGVVKDTSGGVLPGVTVQVASPALIERTRETVSDGTGQYRFVDLRPGTYSVTATLTGFNTFVRGGLEISGSGTFTINADMKVGAIEETVTVSGETPVVDLQSTTRERVMSKEVLDALPTGRMYYTLGVLVPGVNSSSRDVGGALGDTMGSLTAHGGSSGDQRVMQNGLNVMTLQTGGGNIGGSVPNTSAAQEVAIDSASASAERSTGGVSINFIPRDGGNTVRGSVFFTQANEFQQASNFTQELKDAGLSRVNKFKQNWDFNPGIGGPILRDKVWYYYTYRNNGAFNYAAGMFYNQNEFPTATQFPGSTNGFSGPLGNVPESWTYRAADGTNGASERPALSQHGDWWDSQIRLTWQMDPKNKFAGTWDQQFYCRCPNGVSSTTSPEAANDRRFPVQQLIHGEWWSPLTSKMLLEVVALHRTERWGNMALRPTGDGGSLNVTPAQYALYPSMIGVTQTNGGPQPDTQFHGPSGTFNNNWVPNYTYRWAVSYITGAHAFKVGGEDAFGYTSSTVFVPTFDTQNRPVRYRFSNTNTPDQVTVYNSPYSWKQDVDHNIGLFVQDRWTANRLTLNAGVRYDYFKSSIPALDLLPSSIGRPAASFAAIDNAMNWKDVTPRLGVAYDVQGDGKTALKVSLNKYVAGQGGGALTGGANPITRLTNNTNRNWNDANGNKIVDCNLTNPAVNGECTNAGSATLLSTAIPGATATNPDGLFDRNVREGWGKRSYNWEFSMGVQREVMPRVSVDVSYFRRWFGNFTATDNQAIILATGLPIGAADYRSFSIVTPTDSRLPGGGAQTITGFQDFNSTQAATVTAINRTVFTDDIGASQKSNWHGVDVGINARLQNGLLIQGGTSTGRQYTNDCEVSAILPETLGNNPMSHCEQTEPMRTQFKLVSAYTLPRYASLPTVMAVLLQNIQIAGTFQSLPGNEMNATYSMPNSEFRNAALSGIGGAAGIVAGCAATAVSGANPTGGGLCNGNTKTVAITNPVSIYDKRMNQLDIRFGRILRFGRTRTSLNFDVFNAFNDSTVLNRNNSFSKTPSFNATTGIGINNAVNSLWAPSTILQARFYKLTATFDF